MRWSSKTEVQPHPEDCCCSAIVVKVYEREKCFKCLKKVSYKNFVLNRGINKISKLFFFVGGDHGDLTTSIQKNTMFLSSIRSSPRYELLIYPYIKDK